MVKKRLYLGEYRYGDHPEGHYHWASSDGVQDGCNTDKSRRYRPAENPVVIPKTHKALVTVADFERCQTMLQDRTRIKSPYRPKGNPYLLASLLKCGHCNSAMIGTKHNYPKSPQSNHRAYLCSGYQQSGTSVCKRHYVREEIIFDVLVRKLEAEFLDPARLTLLRKEIRKQLTPVKSAEDPQQLRKQIAALAKRIDQGAGKMLVAPPSLTAILTAKLDEWRHQREALESRLQALAKPQATTTGEVDKLVDEAIGELQRLREGIHQADRTLVRDVLREMVSKVELWFKWRPERKQNRAVLSRGLIHLRPDLQTIRLVSDVLP